MNEPTTKYNTPYMFRPQAVSYGTVSRFEDTSWGKRQPYGIHTEFVLVVSGLNNDNRFLSLKAVSWTDTLVKYNNYGNFEDNSFQANGKQVVELANVLALENKLKLAISDGAMLKIYERNGIIKGIKFGDERIIVPYKTKLIA